MSTAIPTVMRQEAGTEEGGTAGRAMSTPAPLCYKRSARRLAAVAKKRRPWPPIAYVRQARDARAELRAKRGHGPILAYRWVMPEAKTMMTPERARVQAWGGG
jgi:hypothetical protein